MLELHGWGDLHPELNTLSKRGEWVKMGELIDDEVLDAFAVVAPLDEVPARVLDRFGDVVDGSASTRPTGSTPSSGARSSAGFTHGLTARRRRPGVRRPR